MAKGVLRNVRVKRVALVDMGANFDAKTGDGAHIMLFKRVAQKDAGPGLGSVHADSPDWDADDQDEYEKATLNAEQRRAIPDSGYAAVWTDAEGKKHRKLPIHDAGHLAAARGRIDAADIPADVKAAARRKIEAATGDSNSGHKETKKMKLKDVLKMFGVAAAEPDATKRTELLAKAAEAVEKMDEGTEPVAKEHVDAMKAHVASADAMLKAFGEGPHPTGHPYHALKASYDEMCKALAAAGGDSGLPPSMPAEVGKRLTAMEKANADLQKRLDAEVIKGVRAEVTTVLKSFKAVPLKLEGEGNDIDRYTELYQANKALYDRQIELFKAADTQLASSTAFKNLGAGGGGSSTGQDAWAKIEAEADKLLEKAAGKGLTKEAAIEKILCDPTHNKLVQEYRNAQQ